MFDYDLQYSDSLLFRDRYPLRGPRLISIAFLVHHELSILAVELISTLEQIVKKCQVSSEFGTQIWRTSHAQEMFFMMPSERC